MKLKLRREARLATRANDSSVSASSRSSPVRYSLPSLPPLNPQASRIAKPSLDSELDFSPSVGIDRLHPVPISTDDGATLDWGGIFSEEDRSDRKWSLSLTKRKPKDKPFPTHSRDALERQEAAFSGNSSVSNPPDMRSHMSCDRENLQDQVICTTSHIEKGRDYR